MFVELIANSHQIDYTHTFQLMSCLQMNVFENTQFIFFTQGYVAGCPIHMSSFLAVKLNFQNRGIMMKAYQLLSRYQCSDMKRFQTNTTLCLKLFTKCLGLTNILIN